MTSGTTLIVEYLDKDVNKGSDKYVPLPSSSSSRISHHLL